MRYHEIKRDQITFNGIKLDLIGSDETNKIRWDQIRWYDLTLMDRLDKIRLNEIIWD